MWSKTVLSNQWLPSRSLLYHSSTFRKVLSEKHLVLFIEFARSAADRFIRLAILP